MRPLRMFILLVLLVLLALIAVDAMFSGWWGLPPHPVQQMINDYITPRWTHWLSQDHIWRAAWGLVLGLIVLEALLTIAMWNRRPKAIRTRTSDGEVMLIHPGALLKFVKLQVESHPAVVSHKVRIRQRGSRGLAIWVWINVQPIDSLPNIKRRIEYNIRDGFARIMGIEKIDDVTIVIGLDEKSLNRRPGPANGASEPAPEPPVRGPVEPPPARAQEDLGARYAPSATAAEQAATSDWVEARLDEPKTNHSEEETDRT